LEKLDRRRERDVTCHISQLDDEWTTLRPNVDDDRVAIDDVELADVAIEEAVGNGASVGRTRVTRRRAACASGEDVKRQERGSASDGGSSESCDASHGRHLRERSISLYVSRLSLSIRSLCVEASRRGSARRAGVPLGRNACPAPRCEAL